MKCIGLVETGMSSAKNCRHHVRVKVLDFVYVQKYYPEPVWICANVIRINFPPYEDKCLVPETFPTSIQSGLAHGHELVCFIPDLLPG